ncbi:reverse transcriptase domain-containing protein [Tanacetum coccineum]
MEVFTLVLQRHIDKEKWFQYHFGCKAIKLSHIFFANDLLVMCHGDTNFVRVIKNALDEFNACSGIFLISSKSTVFFYGLSNEEKTAITLVLPFVTRKLPMRYLEVPLIAKRLGVKDCGRMRAFEQVTRDLDVEIKQMKELKASYGVTTPQELRRNQVNEGMSRHPSYGVNASSYLHCNQHHQGRMTYPSHRYSAPSMVKPEIGGNVNFKIKSQFIREFREDTFSENKNDDAHEHVERVLDIVSLFNIPGVTHDAVMLRVFPITLNGAAKRYCLPSKTAKQFEDICNFKQEGDKTLYQAWERYNLYKCPTHDINSHQKVSIFYNGLGTMNRQLLDSQGPIPGMTHAQALTAIQTMADHSQKWHDGSSSRNIDSSSSNSKGIAAIVSKLDSLGRDIKKLKENVHAIKIGCQLCGGAHLDKECPLNEEVKSVEEVKYYTRLYNRPPFGEKRPSLEELMNKHLEDSIQRRAEMEEWVKKLQENTGINTRNQSASLKNLETQIEHLTKEFHAKTASEATTSSDGQCKAVYTNNEAPLDSTTNEPHEVSFISNDGIQVDQEEGMPSRVLPCQLPPKELNLRSFTLPCTIRNLNFYAMADLGASVNFIPKSLFEHLKLANLKATNMLVEMADMTKRAPVGIVENVLVKIDKFLFPSDFMVIEMLNARNETMILERPFLATIHAEIDVFNKEISLGIRDDKISFDMDKKFHNFTTHEQNSKKENMIKKNTPSAHFCKPIKQIYSGALKVWPTCDPTMKVCNGGNEIYGMDEEGVLKYWYRETQGEDLIWDSRFSQQGNEIRGRIRAFEQETRDLDVEIKQINELKASYGVTTPQELRRNQVNEGMSQHPSFGVNASSCLHHNQHRQGRMNYPSHRYGVTSTQGLRRNTI